MFTQQFGIWRKKGAAVFPPQDGLLAYYPCDGNLNDTSGNGNNGTINEGMPGSVTTVSDRFANPSAALRTSLNNDYLDLNTITGLNTSSTWSLSLWERLESNITSGRLYSFGTGSFTLTAFFPGAATNFRSLSSTGLNVTHTGIGFINNWVNFIFTYDGSQYKLYLNNVAAAVASGSETGAINNNNRVIIHNDTNPTAGIIGAVDDIIIYNKVLSSEERTIIYNQTIYNGKSLKKDKDIRNGS